MRIDQLPEDPVEIIDYVSDYLLTQREKSGRYSHINQNQAQFICQYRDRKGRRCAVGCLIPDELYNNYMEGTPVKALVAMFGDWLLTREQLTVLTELQSIHDVRDPTDWPSELAECRQRWAAKK